MSAVFHRTAGAGELLVRHIRHSPASAPSRRHSRSFVRSRLLPNKLKEPSSPAAPSFSVPSLRTSSCSSSSKVRRNGFVSWYLGMIEARPVLTKSLTAGAIFTAADISSQMITIAPTDFLDWKRTARMAGYGFLVSGPTLHLWFNFLSGIIPKRDLVNTLKKMFLGQAVYGPIINIVFFSGNAALQGETSSEIYARLKRDLIPTLKSGIIYWPICDFITFKFTPVHLQPLVSNSFSFLWTIYITYMANLEKAIVEKKSTD